MPDIARHQPRPKAGGWMPWLDGSRSAGGKEFDTDLTTTGRCEAPCRSCSRGHDVADAGYRPALVVHEHSGYFGNLGYDGVENPFSLLGERP